MERFLAARAAILILHCVATGECNIEYDSDVITGLEKCGEPRAM